MAALVARTGRQRQRYHNGFRLTAGCIPYRYTRTGDACDGESVETLEVLMVTRRRGHGFLFPKGGWEDDETKEEAALREALEEAGVKGHIEADLGSWPFKNGRCCDEHSLQGSSTGYMFALNVTEVLDSWPEKDVRQRKWVTVKEAKDLCRHPWMLNSLEKCIDYLSRRRSIYCLNLLMVAPPRILSQPTCEDEEPSEQSTCEETDSSLAAIESNEAGSADEELRKTKEHSQNE